MPDKENKKIADTERDLDDSPSKNNYFG